VRTLINLLGLGIAGLIVWWFWGSRPKALRAGGSAPVEVRVENGVYTPAYIEVTAGQPVTLRFLRKDPSPCAEKVTFDALGVSADLPLDEPVTLTVTPPQPGEYEFTCAMHMYRGRLAAR